MHDVPNTCIYPRQSLLARRCSDSEVEQTGCTLVGATWPLGCISSATARTRSLPVSCGSISPLLG